MYRTLLARLDRLDGWTCANDRRLAELDDKINRVLDRLPDPAGEGERDGPVEPLDFRLGGTLYEGFRPLEWMLLKCLWEKKRHSATVQDAIEKVYGVNAEGKDKAIVSVLKRLNRKLFGESAPASVRQKAGHLLLDLSEHRGETGKGSSEG